MNFLNRIKKLFTDKYFIIFFFGSIAASVAGFLLLESIQKNSIYGRHGYIMFKENVSWMLIVILYSPAYILSRLFPFLGDVIDFAFLVVQGFMYGFIGLRIKNIILARRIQKEQNVFSLEPKISASQNKKFGVIVVYYTIIAAIIYTIFTVIVYNFNLDRGIFINKIIPFLWLMMIDYSAYIGFIGLIISIIGMFKDNKKTLSVIMFILYGIILTLIQYLLPPVERFIVD